MKNKLATLRNALVSPRSLSLFMLASSLAWIGWGVWATKTITALEHRQIVSVQLSKLMGDFVESEARAGRPAEETRARVAAYLQAVQASVASLGSNGRTVLVAEAVVAGQVPDVTNAVRGDVARRMEALSHAQR